MDDISELSNKMIDAKYGSTSKLEVDLAKSIPDKDLAKNIVRGYTQQLSWMEYKKIDMDKLSNVMSYYDPNLLTTFEKVKGNATIKDICNGGNPESKLANEICENLVNYALKNGYLDEVKHNISNALFSQIKDKYHPSLVSVNIDEDGNINRYTTNCELVQDPENPEDAVVMCEDEPEAIIYGNSDEIHKSAVELIEEHLLSADIPIQDFIANPEQYKGLFIEKMQENGYPTRSITIHYPAFYPNEFDEEDVGEYKSKYSGRVIGAKRIVSLDDKEYIDYVILEEGE